MPFPRTSVLLLVCLSIGVSVPLARTVAGMVDEPQTPATEVKPDDLALRRDAARQQLAVEMEKLFAEQEVLLAELDRGFRAATTEDEALEVLEKMHAAKTGAERRALEIRIEAAVANGLDDDARELRAALAAYDAERSRIADSNSSGSAVGGGQRR